jgi:hypothetical protein
MAAPVTRRDVLHAGLLRVRDVVAGVADIVSALTADPELWKKGVNRIVVSARDPGGGASVKSARFEVCR